jgi:hypothetical protein
MMILRLNIQLLEDLEEELGLGSLEHVRELRELGERLKERMDMIAKVLRLLEKHGWAWTTGARDIILYKNISKEDAKKMFKELKIPEDIIEFD